VNPERLKSIVLYWLQVLTRTFIQAEPWVGKPDGAPLPLVTMLLVALAPSHAPFSSMLSQLLSMAGQMIWVGVAVGTPQGFSVLRLSTRIVPVKVVP